MILQTLFDLAILLLVPLAIITPAVIIVITFMAGPLRKYNGVTKKGNKKKNLNIFQMFIRYCDDNQWKFIGYIIVGYFVVLLLFDLTAFGGNIKYYKKAIECHHAPYLYKGSLLGVYSEVPEKSNVIPGAFKGFNGYTCSKDEEYHDPYGFQF